MAHRMIFIVCVDASQEEYLCADGLRLICEIRSIVNPLAANVELLFIGGDWLLAEIRDWIRGK